MKLVYIFIALLFAINDGYAQDTSLPSEKFKIILHNGKKIEHATLWKIDSTQVEYVKNGNLGGIVSSDVYYMESLNFRIDFDSTFQGTLIHYDLIILNNGDTVRGLITHVTKNNIQYIPAGKPNSNPILRSYQSYIFNNEEIEMEKDEERLTVTSDNNTKTKNQAEAKKETKTKSSTKTKFSVGSCCLGMVITPVISIVFLILTGSFYY